MRDKLIELILECSTFTPEYAEQERLHAEYVAQHLLNNNVIVPPCKVGQTVYIIGWDDNIEEFTVKDIAYEKGSFGVYFYRFRAAQARESRKALAERSENGT